MYISKFSDPSAGQYPHHHYYHVPILCLDSNRDDSNHPFTYTDLQVRLETPKSFPFPPCSTVTYHFVVTYYFVVWLYCSSKSWPSSRCPDRPCVAIARFPGAWRLSPTTVWSGETRHCRCSWLSESPGNPADCGRSTKLPLSCRYLGTLGTHLRIIVVDPFF